MKALLYCTKGKDHLVKDYDLFEEFVGFKITNDLTNSKSLNGLSKALNGKIVCEVEIDKVEAIYHGRLLVFGSLFYCTKTLSCVNLLEKTQLNLTDIQDYLKEDIGYALHLANLKVFDRPKELFEYSKRLPSGDFQQLGKAPQNMMNVCEIKYLIEDYVLISIQPQHLCKILNGEKTIEVRRKVINTLKEMCKDE